ncbi:hypothetical protein ACFL6I_21245 [candidate division KSB1 bacterium]
MTQVAKLFRASADLIIDLMEILKTPRHKVKYLHQNTFTEINFYKDTVLFIMLLNKPMVIRVKNKEAADSFRKFFETMWEIAKP